MQAELRSDTFKIESLNIPIEEAKAFLVLHYPSLLDAFVFRRTVAANGETRRVDWQGCLLHPVTKAILYGYFSKPITSNSRGLK